MFKLYRYMLLTICGLITGLTYAQESLTIDQAWARETPPGVMNSAVYLTIHNPADAEDQLIGASSVAADRTELHTSIEENDVMKMRPKDSIAVQKNGMAMLKPGGDHVMLLDLHQPLKEGDTIQLELEFKNSGTIRIDVPVMKKGHDTHKHSG